jgi:hypothetical protein
MDEHDVQSRHPRAAGGNGVVLGDDSYESAMSVKFQPRGLSNYDGGVSVATVLIIFA